MAATRRANNPGLKPKGEKKFRAGQLWDWLYRKRVTSFEEMTNLPKSLIEQLQEEFTFPVWNERIKQQSTDENVNSSLN